MARPRRGPGKPGPPRVRAHPRHAAEPCPHLAAPPLGHAHTVPHHGCTMTPSCAVTPNAATMSRSCRGQALSSISSSTHWTHASSHTQDHPGPSRTGSGSHTRSGGRPTSGPCLSGGSVGRCTLGPFHQRERGGECWTVVGLLG
jgi:hypothetical protein